MFDWRMMAAGSGAALQLSGLVGWPSTCKARAVHATCMHHEKHAEQTPSLLSSSKSLVYSAFYSLDGCERGKAALERIRQPATQLH